MVSGRRGLQLKFGSVNRERNFLQLVQHKSAALLGSTRSVGHTMLLARLFSPARALVVHISDGNSGVDARVEALSVSHDAHLVAAEPREHPDNVAHQSCTSAPHSLLLVQRDEGEIDRVLRHSSGPLGGTERHAHRRRRQ